MEIINLRDICRLCSNREESVVNVTKIENSINLQLEIYKFFHIQITKDSISQVICLNCFRFVSDFLNFVKRCSKVQTMFENLSHKENLSFNELQDLQKKYEIIANNTKASFNHNQDNVEMPFVCEYDHDQDSNLSLDIKEEITITPVQAELKNCSERKVNYEKKLKRKKCSIDKIDKIVEKPNKENTNDNDSIISNLRKRNKSNKLLRSKSLEKEPSEVSIQKDVNMVSSKSKSLESIEELSDNKETSYTKIRGIYYCSYCNKRFTKPSTLNIHTRAVHLNERPYACEECGKKCATKGALKEHKYIHVEETPYQCSKCAKKFKNASRLRTHEDTHNETVYICTVCGLQLNTRRTLQMHKVVHSDQKKYKCEYCQRDFKRSKALKNHLILHTGLRPYPCPFCERTFANGSNRRSHTKKAHPNELAEMEAAGENCIALQMPKLQELKTAFQIENVSSTDETETITNNPTIVCKEEIVIEDEL